MARDEALGDGVSDDARQQANRTNGVIVAGNRVRHFVGVAVRVENSNNGDAELACLVNSEVLLLGVDNPHRAWRLSEVADTAEALVELVELPLLDEEFLLGEAALARIFEVKLFEFFHAGEALADRLEVGEQTAEPTLVDEGLSDTSCLVADGLLGLLLGANEKDRATVGNGVTHEFVRLVDVGKRLLKVDDVNARTFGKNESLYLRVPPTSLVSKVNAAVEQLANGYNGHGHVLILRRARATPICGFVAFLRWR